ncbi:hypothetical protein BDR03DRAFT_1017926 [Suillus americanus]|nr:hypothetical protein BDR03DRAFT_1017926 [Suillus americanus]
MDVDSIVPPPGEEGFSVSHAGDEVSLYRELETITITKTCGQIAHLIAEWTSQYNNLTDAFLTYKPNSTPPPTSDNETEFFH